MCELAFNVAKERHGNGMVFVNPPLLCHVLLAVGQFSPGSDTVLTVA
jgi:hypothetical protein